MNQKELNAGRQEALEGFDIPGRFVECVPCGNGHINDTYMVTFEEENGLCRYSLQHMNRSVFKDPVSLMNNILHVTAYLKEQIRSQGGDPAEGNAGFCLHENGGGRILWTVTGSTGGRIISWRMRTRWRRSAIRRIFMRARLHLAIFSGCWRTSRRTA